jgi:peroxiredoxin (alkyl hydroperoxide reductase subunit C)
MTRYSSSTLLDSTFVCPTELHAFQAALGEFEKRDTAAVACFSVDSVNSHFSWLQMPKDQGGIQRRNLTRRW